MTGLNATLLIGWIIFLSPAIQYLIYETATDKVGKRWYARGLRYWWRPIVMAFLIALVVAVIAFVWGITFYLVFELNHSIVLSIIRVILHSIFYISIFVFLLISNAASFAEKRFIDSIDNVYGAVARHFIKIAVIIITTAIPFAFEYYMAYTGADIGIIWGVASLLWIRLAQAFACIFAMHCYLEYREYAILKQKEQSEKLMEEVGAL